MKIRGFDDALNEDLDVKKFMTNEKTPQASKILIADQMRRARSLSESFSLSDNSSAYQESSGSDIGNEYDIVKVKVDKKDG